MADIARRAGAPEQHWTWPAEAACRTGDSSVFLGRADEGGADLEERRRAAKAVCAGCAVRVECRRHALATREPYGIRGGLTEEERRALFTRGTAPVSRVA
ncbi:WhiB family transcriptional regulator [Streptomyces sp. NRRL S-350]|uniref:WhiB family transcriptional regulator n=1 Tax=Streptomyces sp. NRRL S-350 TaxID=1463902 RepID=UPI0004C1B748|nr:WhiB family transcriptional regulator [Streptomyces sp. NRRL S-350]